MAQNSKHTICFLVLMTFPLTMNKFLRKKGLKPILFSTLLKHGPLPRGNHPQLTCRYGNIAVELKGRDHPIKMVQSFPKINPSKFDNKYLSQTCRGYEKKVKAKVNRILTARDAGTKGLFIGVSILVPLTLRAHAQKLRSGSHRTLGIMKGPWETPFFNFTFDKGRLKNLVTWTLENYGEYKTVELLEQLKKTGFEYATKAGISLGIEDLKIPPKKCLLLLEAEKQTKLTSQQYKRGDITAVERFKRLIDTWHRTSEQLKQEVIFYFEETNVLNPVYMMAFSGARGNISQVRQLVGMRGLMSDPKGQIIDYPIRSNFREGLTLTEYIISSYGSRKGIVDTALRTANAGYLTRRLVDVAQHVIISNFDCGTQRGIFVADLKEGNKSILSLQNRLIGRVLARDVMHKIPDHKVGGEEQLLASKNQEISSSLAGEIARVTNRVFIRSSLTCETTKLICQLCYGWSLAQGKLVSIGETVGVIAAQSIGEPGTQLTMRTFHTGGVFAGDISDEIRAPFDGFIEYTHAIPGSLIRTLDGKIAFLTKSDGTLIMGECQNPSLLLHSNKIKKYKIPAYTVLFCRNGQRIYKKQVVAQITNQVNASDTAEYPINSELEGVFYAKNIQFQKKLIGPKPKSLDDILAFQGMEIQLESKDWNFAWVLSGKRYEIPFFAPLFARIGDYLTTQTVMTQNIWATQKHQTFFKTVNPIYNAIHIGKIKSSPIVNNAPTIYNSHNSTFISTKKASEGVACVQGYSKPATSKFFKFLLNINIKKIKYNSSSYFLITSRSEKLYYEPNTKQSQQNIFSLPVGFTTNQKQNRKPLKSLAEWRSLNSKVLGSHDNPSKTIFFLATKKGAFIPFNKFSVCNQHKKKVYWGSVLSNISTYINRKSSVSVPTTSARGPATSRVSNTPPLLSLKRLFFSKSLNTVPILNKRGTKHILKHICKQHTTFPKFNYKNFKFYNPLIVPDYKDYKGGDALRVNTVYNSQFHKKNVFISPHFIRRGLLSPKLLSPKLLSPKIGLRDACVLRTQVLRSAPHRIRSIIKCGNSANVASAPVGKKMQKLAYKMLYSLASNEKTRFGTFWFRKVHPQKSLHQIKREGKYMGRAKFNAQQILLKNTLLQRRVTGLQRTGISAKSTSVQTNGYCLNKVKLNKNHFSSILKKNIPYVKTLRRLSKLPKLYDKFTYAHSQFTANTRLTKLIPLYSKVNHVFLSLYFFSNLFAAGLQKNGLERPKRSIIKKIKRKSNLNKILTLLRYVLPYKAGSMSNLSRVSHNKNLPRSNVSPTNFTVWVKNKKYKDDSSINCSEHFKTIINNNKPVVVGRKSLPTTTGRQWPYNYRGDLRPTTTAKPRVFAYDKPSYNMMWGGSACVLYTNPYDKAQGGQNKNNMARRKNECNPLLKQYKMFLKEKMRNDPDFYAPALCFNKRIKSSPHVIRRGVESGSLLIGHPDRYTSLKLLQKINSKMFFNKQKKTLNLVPKTTTLNVVLNRKNVSTYLQLNTFTSYLHKGARLNNMPSPERGRARVEPRSVNKNKGRSKLSSHSQHLNTTSTNKVKSSLDKINLVRKTKSLHGGGLYYRRSVFYNKKLHKEAPNEAFNFLSRGQHFYTSSLTPFYFLTKMVHFKIQGAYSRGYLKTTKADPNNERPYRSAYEALAALGQKQKVTEPTFIIDKDSRSSSYKLEVPYYIPIILGSHYNKKREFQIFKPRVMPILTGKTSVQPLVVGRKSPHNYTGPWRPVVVGSAVVVPTTTGLRSARKCAGRQWLRDLRPTTTADPTRAKPKRNLVKTNYFSPFEGESLQCYDKKSVYFKNDLNKKSKHVDKHVDKNFAQFNVFLTTKDFVSLSYKDDSIRSNTRTGSLSFMVNNRLFNLLQMVNPNASFAGTCDTSSPILRSYRKFLFKVVDINKQLHYNKLKTLNLPFSSCCEATLISKNPTPYLLKNKRVGSAVVVGRKSLSVVVGRDLRPTTTAEPTTTGIKKWLWLKQHNFLSKNQIGSFFVKGSSLKKHCSSLSAYKTNSLKAEYIKTLSLSYAADECSLTPRYLEINPGWCKQKYKTMVQNYLFNSLSEVIGERHVISTNLEFSELEPSPRTDVQSVSLMLLRDIRKYDFSKETMSGALAYKELDGVYGFGKSLDSNATRTNAHDKDLFKIVPIHKSDRNKAMFLKAFHALESPNSHRPFTVIKKAGQLIHMNHQTITVRLGQPLVISPRSIIHAYHGDFVRLKKPVITLTYEQLKTGDIVQGIPKIEQLFEARTTKRGRLFRDNLTTLLNGLFIKYYAKSYFLLKKSSFYANPSEGTAGKNVVESQFNGTTYRPIVQNNGTASQNQYPPRSGDNNNQSFYYGACRGVVLASALKWAVKQSFYKIQQIIVDGILRVYRSQGVSISDKHVEIIVKQMTSKVRIISANSTKVQEYLFSLKAISPSESQSKGSAFIKKNGNYHQDGQAAQSIIETLIENNQLNPAGLFPGEIVDFNFVENLNAFLLFNGHSKNTPSLYQPIKYEPIVLGITRASLEVESFLSAASFQQTTRVLSQAALYKKKDYLKGLKENILIGNLIPAGTGYF